MLRIAETRKLTTETVQPRKTFALLTATAIESGFAQAAPADVKAVAPVGAVTGLVAVLSVFADGTLFAASWGGKEQEDEEWKTGASSSWSTAGLENGLTKVNSKTVVVVVGEERLSQAHHHHCKRDPLDPDHAKPKEPRMTHGITSEYSL